MVVLAMKVAFEAKMASQGAVDEYGSMQAC